jgi:CheY-like chemotaxis protein
MKALCNTLQDHNYKTVGFSSAKAALAELEKTEFDLLLNDLMMPEMNGIQ